VSCAKNGWTDLNNGLILTIYTYGFLGGHNDCTCIKIFRDIYFLNRD